MARTRSKPRAWSGKESQILRRLYAKLPLEKLARLLCRTVKSVTSRAKVMRLKRSNRKKWTAAENAELRRLYPHSQDSAALIRRFRCTRSQLYGQARRLDLAKTPETHLAINRQCGRQLIASGVNHRFPKGHVPANKGTRRPGYAPGRMRETQFKKGVATNWMPIGATRLIDGYLYRKVSDIRNVPHTRNWVAEHIRIWEEVNGPLNRRTHCLRFRDNDRTHVSLDNLEFITRKENRARNSIHALPPKLKELYILKGAIQRQITRKTQRAEASA